MAHPFLSKTYTAVVGLLNPGECLTLIMQGVAYTITDSRNSTGSPIKCEQRLTFSEMRYHS